MSDNSPDQYGDDFRTVRVVVAYRVRVPADVPLIRLTVDRKLSAPPITYLTGTMGDDGGPGDIKRVRLNPEFLSYQYVFKEENHGVFPADPFFCDTRSSTELAQTLRETLADLENHIDSRASVLAAERVEKLREESGAMLIESAQQVQHWRDCFEERGRQITAVTHGWLDLARDIVRAADPAADEKERERISHRAKSMITALVGDLEGR